MIDLVSDTLPAKLTDNGTGDPLIAFLTLFAMRYAIYYNEPETKEYFEKEYHKRVKHQLINGRYVLKSFVHFFLLFFVFFFSKEKSTRVP